MYGQDSIALNKMLNGLVFWCVGQRKIGKMSTKLFTVKYKGRPLFFGKNSILCTAVSVTRIICSSVRGAFGVIDCSTVLAITETPMLMFWKTSLIIPDSICIQNGRHELGTHPVENNAAVFWWLKMKNTHRSCRGKGAFQDDQSTNQLNP